MTEKILIIEDEEDFPQWRLESRNLKTRDVSWTEPQTGQSTGDEDVTIKWCSNVRLIWQEYYESYRAEGDFSITSRKPAGAMETPAGKPVHC